MLFRSKFGGKPLGGGKPELLEGDSSPGYAGIFQFPDMATARAFYNSPEYTRLVEFRKNAATARLLLIEGR